MFGSLQPSLDIVALAQCVIAGLGQSPASSNMATMSSELGGSSGSKAPENPPPPARVRFHDSVHEVGEMLGKGAFASVHALRPAEAVAGPSQPALCAKLVYAPGLSAGGRDRIKSEVQIWEAVGAHPNIIRFVVRAVEEKWLVRRPQDDPPALTDPVPDRARALEPRTRT